MTASVKNIVLILSFIVLLPIAIFTAIEVSALNENEKALEKAYREQLDAIIFSINQYSADLFTFYFNQIDYQWQQSDSERLFDSLFLQQNLAIEALVINQSNQSFLYDLNSFQSYPIIAKDFDSLFLNNEDKIQRLIRYKEAGYLKPEALGSIPYQEDTLSVNLIVVGAATPCLFCINPENYVEDLLGPKIKEIASNALNVTIKHKTTNRYVYFEGTEPEGIVQKGQLWLLDDYEIGVSLQDQSIEALIAYRTKRSLLSMALLVILVIVGIVLVARNLKREIQLSKAKADFVANVSHEIRTPLSLISMFNETLLLDRVPNEEKKKEYYKVISKETARLKSIVNKILSFSQIDADKKEYRLTTIDPNLDLKEIIHTYSYHLENKGFTYEMNLDSQNLSIDADKEAFTEAIVNLIDNAMKYSDEEKHISFRTYSTNDYYIVSIADKGIGIAKNEKQQIFEKFYRVNEVDRPFSKGTGLGLSLVASIMRAHRGKVELESELGKGSTFKLMFPLK